MLKKYTPEQLRLFVAQFFLNFGVYPLFYIILISIFAFWNIMLLPVPNYAFHGAAFIVVNVSAIYINSHFKSSVKRVFLINLITLIIINSFFILFSLETLFEVISCKASLEQLIEDRERCSAVLENSRVLVLNIVIFVYTVAYVSLNTLAYFLKKKKDLKLKSAYILLVLSVPLLLSLAYSLYWQNRKNVMVTRLREAYPEMRVDSNGVIWYKDYPQNTPQIKNIDASFNISQQDMSTTEVELETNSYSTNTEVSQLNNYPDQSMISDTGCDGYVSNSDYTWYAYLKFETVFNQGLTDTQTVCDPQVASISLWIGSSNKPINDYRLVGGDMKVSSFRWVDNTTIEYTSRDAVGSTFTKQISLDKDY